MSDIYRRREIDLIFSKCPEKSFQTGLELGAGDGFQSTLLTKYVSKLTSTDYDPGILKRASSESVEYRVCDAEEADKLFGKGQFDLVFSSNLLEHLPNPGRALVAIGEVLKDDGITIHVMPSPFWKLCHLLLYVPNKCVVVLEKITEKGGLGEMLRRMTRRAKGLSNDYSEGFENNPKIQRAPRSFVHRLLIPEPHGVSSGSVDEFYAFSESRWRKEFEKADLELVKIIKGPVSSGYGFGLYFVRSVLERFGFASEYIYLAVKNGG